MQARINGELAVRLGDGVAAAVVSFGVGLVILTVAVAVSPAGRRGLRAVVAALRSGGLRWWQTLGGVCGAFVVTSQGLTVASLGVAVFTVALVAGQTTSGLAVDRLGLGPSGAEPVSAPRIVGAVLCVAAVLLSVSDRFSAPQALGLALLPLLAGVGIAWQQAVNGRVRAAAGATAPPTFVNFVTGTAALLVAFTTVVAVRGWPPGALPPEPWLYAGGAIGVLMIATAAAVVRFTGVLVLGLGTVSGQVVGALALDLVVPTHARPGWHTYTGAVLALTAVAIATLPPGTLRALAHRATRASRAAEAARAQPASDE